ncbi:cytochrome c3 family protein [Roseiconus lacunae]|uniref:cytochrome c3 family protein n=1 Tax=Roseiconus lacunae TaxID=2605694 RepID=UPI001E45BDA4|nr:cytochrome c3 family protein [Roseiconus lacunae]MCD0461227.1 hypothetical protein [Roseiconus lacunae]
MGDGLFERPPRRCQIVASIVNDYDMMPQNRTTLALFSSAAVFLGALFLGVFVPVDRCDAAGDSKYAHHDGNARFLHHIHLYDASNKRIAPDSTTPYSSVNTCGRCHDYDTISHGWHFNAFMADTADGREGEPWIWTDARTGTQLPLSYRDGKQSFDPRKLGIDRWSMVKQFGGRLPGGPIGAPPEPITPDEAAPDEANAASSEGQSGAPESPSRWGLTGSLEIDCLACHGVSGSYDFNQRREQIAKENFAWAATAALRIAEIKGDVSRIKDGSDPNDEATQKRMPQVTYDARRFATDGTVFIDLIRQPENNACYQCHSQRTVNLATPNDAAGHGDDFGIQARWPHDQDVHLRGGMNCVDCHRNGIDHHIVRGFPGEDHPSGKSMVTLSCAGCHLGTEFATSHLGTEDEHAKDERHDEFSTEDLAGRLGSPLPGHAGLPALHFEKLSCTACHAGPIPRDEALGMMTSLAHSLGEKAHRSGEELPRIQGPVYAKANDGRIYPHRVMWPAYWATIEGGKIQPIDPNKLYDITRRSLRVRNSFAEDILEPKLKSSELKELLGEDRYRTKEDEWTAEEAANVSAAVREAGQALFAEKVWVSLREIEKETGAAQAVYVSAGFVYAATDEENTLEKIEIEDTDAIDMIQWPIAHNVRPAGWALGAKGCVECHQDNGKLFAGTVTPLGPGPDAGSPITMASLQGIDANQRLTWNQLFQNRSSFKYIIAGSVLLLAVAVLLTAGILLGRLGAKTTTS